MRKIALLLFISFAAFQLQAQVNDLYIVLLAGQSNMAGRGVSRPAIDTITYNNIYSLNKDLKWIRARNPLHWDKAEAAVGMGITFAHELALKIGGNVKIGLVPCAAGGTSIDNWLSSTYIYNYNGNSFNLYTNLIGRAKEAAKSGQIIGMIWHQGESDATTALYPTYQNKLKTLFLKIRTDIGISDLPIVAGELGTYLQTNTTCPRWDSINVSINRLKKVLPAYDVASSAGLTPNSDNTHFTSASQVILGSRYAELFYPIASGTSAIASAVQQPFSMKVMNHTVHISQRSGCSTKVKFHSLIGNLIKMTTIKSEENDISTFGMKGYYLVSLENEKGVYTQKVFL